MNAETGHQRIATTHLKNMMDYAMIRGISEQQMLDVIPYSVDYIRDEEKSVRTEEFYTVLAMIDEQLEDDIWGIRAGHYLNMKAMGLIYHISLEAATIEEGFFYLTDYLNATFSLVTIDIQRSDGLVTIQLNIDNNREVLNRIILENTLTIIRREIQLMTGKRTKTDLFSPFYTAEYPDPWNHGQSFALKFKPTILQAALKDKSRLHLDILIPEYLGLIETLTADKSFVSKVKIAALNLSEPALPNLKTVARSFNLTPRTFQRRLSAEETTFREITDDLKRTISNMLLMHKKFTVGDISFVLGYSEPAAFIHTFKKWHGVPPQEARKHL